jgi:hypothetical protein
MVSHSFLRDVLDHRLRPIEDQMVFGRVDIDEAKTA